MESTTTLRTDGEKRLWVVGALVPAVAHGILAVFFYSIGDTAYGHSDVVASAIHLLGLFFVVRGRRFLGLWIVMGSGAPHLVFFLMAMGWETGFAYYFLALLALPFVVFRRHPVHMGLAVGLVVCCTIGALVGTQFVEPWMPLDPRATTLMHAINLLTSVLGLSSAVVVAIDLNRRQQAELARLRAEVLEARKLGQYTLGEKLGAGGMGEVHRATHALLRRPVAIKLIKDGEVSETAMKRFEREVQRTSELTHPNTVEIYDYGRTPEGIFYYVMEYLDGLDLEDLVSQHGPQSPERVIHLWTQACEALEEAHGRGLVHRDIKPANLVLCMRGERPDVIKVLDFGLVMELDAEKGAMDQSIAGTPAYIAPEAVTDPSSIGPAADLYSLGAVFYFVLTGALLFDGKTSFLAWCNAHVSEPPVPVTDRTDAAIPPALALLVMTCLAKDPADRPASARELRHALEAVPLEAEWSEAQAREWWEGYVASTTERAQPSASEVRDMAFGATIDAGALQRAE